MSLIEKAIIRNGVVTSVGAGVVTLKGFLATFVGEQFECQSGLKKSIGQVVNLSRQDQELQIGGILVDPSLRESALDQLLKVKTV